MCERDNKTMQNINNKKLNFFISQRFTNRILEDMKKGEDSFDPTRNQVKEIFDQAFSDYQIEQELIDPDFYLEFSPEQGELSQLEIESR